MVWDPYAQFGSSSTWVTSLDACANSAGATIRRTVVDSADVVAKGTNAEQQGLAPDLLITDSTNIPGLVSGKVLAASGQTKLSSAGIQPSLLNAGEVSGASYGVPVGANTLALFYNKNILKSAGVDPSSINSWSSLTAALAKVKGVGKTGITFSAGPGDASSQFEPWLWGSGASLTKLSSPEAVAALNLWVGWLKDGYASSSVLKSAPAASWQQFAAGGTAFAENASAEMAGAGKLGFPYGVIDIPRQAGGEAPVPAQGEFITIPVQTGTNRYAIDDKIISCLTNSAHGTAIDNALSYVGATAAVQSRQAGTDKALAPFFAAARAEAPEGDVGSGSREMTQRLSSAVRAALSGSASTQSALGAA